MGTENIVVTCTDCGFRESFSTLRDARVALAEHESTTGHTADWEINGLAPGVEQAGADAGVCGSPECGNSESPLLEWDTPDDKP
ncbi:hypothetical protein G6M89_15695 [Natronolimnobius sp. AArcel1]|uniref:DUF7542 family protein n=1 Tax=Natronolimnobius sp. AArcel1 TaxID=1679093 RepID=UPI0013ECC431|nr:hypothetical protein [Natronolimnobius sp. AArcel1]NGM70427.1 hypothetical protein [Natronolimnobius sp. AArcel1]